MGAFREYLSEEVSLLILSEAKDDLISIWPRTHGDGGYVAGSGKRWQNVHDLATVKPRKTGPQFQDRLKRYTGSSHEINTSLDRSAAGYMHQPISGKTASIARGMTKAFTKDTTNQIPLITYSGITPHLGAKLLTAKDGSFHHLAGFTSTTTDKRMAHGYADKKKAGISPDPNLNIPHMIRFHLKPGTGVSAVHHSDYNENEVMVDKGTKIEKVKSQLVPTSHGGKVWLHHVVAHPEKLDLDQYRLGDEHHESGLISRNEGK